MAFPISFPDSTILELEANETVKTSNFDRRFQQFFGLLLKRFHHGRRNFKGLISQILLPAVFVCIAMTVAMSRPGYETLPKLILSPTMIRPLPNYIPINNEGNSQISKKMESTFKLPSGASADCVLKFRNSSLKTLRDIYSIPQNLEKSYDDFCVKQLSKFQKKYEIKHKTAKKAKRARRAAKCRCSADRRNYVCDSGIEGNPDRISTITGDTILNVTGLDMDKYLLYTTGFFKRHRFVDLYVFIYERLCQASAKYSVPASKRLRRICPQTNDSDYSKETRN